MQNTFFILSYVNMRSAILTNYWFKCYTKMIIQKLYGEAALSLISKSVSIFYFSKGIHPVRTKKSE